MIAAMINTTPIMLNTWFPVCDTFTTAKNVALESIDVALPPPPGLGTVVGMFEIVMKNAKTPTAKITKANTAPILQELPIKTTFYLVGVNKFKFHLFYSPIMFSFSVKNLKETRSLLKVEKN